MKRIFTKLKKLFPDKIVTVKCDYWYHGTMPKNRFKESVVYKVYVSDYNFPDSSHNFSPDFNTVLKLEEYLKQNVEGYDKATTKK